MLASHLSMLSETKNVSPASPRRNDSLFFIEFGLPRASAEPLWVSAAHVHLKMSSSVTHLCSFPRESARSYVNGSALRSELCPHVSPLICRKPHQAHEVQGPQEEVHGDGGAWGCDGGSGCGGLWYDHLCWTHKRESVKPGLLASHPSVLLQLRLLADSAHVLPLKATLCEKTSERRRFLGCAAHMWVAGAEFTKRKFAASNFRRTEWGRIGVCFSLLRLWCSSQGEDGWEGEALLQQHTNVPECSPAVRRQVWEMKLFVQPSDFSHRFSEKPGSCWITVNPDIHTRQSWDPFSVGR